MIIDFVSSFFFDILIWLLNRLPDLTAEFEAFLDSGLERIEQLVAIVNAWGYLVPWEIFGVSIQISLWAFGIAIAIKVTRIVASFVTLGGGM